MTRQTRIPCVIQRGGTSKGPYFLASDLPANPALRDRVLLSVMGSPDARQIDGLGGADPLTSKVAIVSNSSIDGVDLDWEFPTGDPDNCGLEGNGCEPYDPCTHALLILAVRAKLDEFGTHKEVSMAMPAGYWLIEKVGSSRYWPLSSQRTVPSPTNALDPILLPIGHASDCQQR